MNNTELAYYLHSVAHELEHSQETFADSVVVVLRRKKVKLPTSHVGVPETICFHWPAAEPVKDSQ